MGKASPSTDWSWYVETWRRRVNSLWSVLEDATRLSLTPEKIMERESLGGGE